jgi:hypothetical protein
MPTAKRMVGSVALALSVGVVLLTTAAFAADIEVQGEDMTRPATGASVATTLSDDEGDSLKFTSNVTANKVVTYSDNSSPIIVRAKGGQTGGSPQLRLRVTAGGTTTTVGTQDVTINEFRNYTFNYSASAGAVRNIKLVSLNVATGRNLYVDHFTIKSDAPADTQAPTTTLTNITSPTNDSTPTFNFSGTDNVGVTAFDVQLDGGAWQNSAVTAVSGAGSYTYATALSDGSHTFAVRSRDATGNVGLTEASQTFTVDTASPAAPTITGGPADGSTDTDGNFTFTFTAAESGGTMQCSLELAADPVNWQPCTTATTAVYSGKADGSYTFQVRQVHAAGNNGTGAVRNFSVAVPSLPSNQAYSAEDYIDSVGIGMQHNFTYYANNHATVVAKTDELDVQHARSAQAPVGNSAWDRLRDIGAVGVDWTLIVNEGDIDTASHTNMTADVNDWLTEGGGYIEAWEGPNEYNNNHQTCVNGQATWGAELFNYQEALWDAVNASNEPNVRVLTPSLGRTGGSDCADQGTGNYPLFSEIPDMSSISDATNLHAYPDGNMPTGSHRAEFDSLWYDQNVPMTQELGGSQPIYMTETGYSTATDTFVHKVSLEAQARYTPRLTMECLRSRDLASEPNANFQTCYTFHLLERKSGTARADNYGLLEWDGSEKPAYRTLENTIDILNDGGHATPGSLNYEITGAHPSTHSLLLREADGSYYLAIWQEVQSYDKPSHTMNTITDDTVTINFESSKSLAVFDVNDITSSGVSDDAETHPTRTLISNSITENVKDTVKIIRVG